MIGHVTDRVMAVASHVTDLVTAVAAYIVM